MKYVQKMLEQMLAQFSYANFAYVVMSEMEPYLSELFVQLQALQKEATAQDQEDQTGGYVVLRFRLVTFLGLTWCGFGSYGLF